MKFEMRRLVTAAATAAVPALAALLAVGRVRRLEVVGLSMWPTLHEGDRLLLVRTRRARPGDLVVVPDPRSAARLMVKRVAGADGAGLILRGDNPAASTDSREFGPVPAGSVRGRVVYRYHPPTRRGRAGRLVP